DVHVPRAGEAGGRRARTEQDRVPGRLVVPGEVDPQAVIEQAGLEAELDLGAALRTQRRVADRGRRDRADVVRAGHRREGPQRVERAGLLTGLAVRGAQAQRVDHRDVPERLLADDPGEGGLRIPDQVEVLTERAVVIRAHRGGQEEPVLPGELLLPEDADGDVLRVRLVAERFRGRV